MKQHLLKIMVFCAACAVLGAQGQSSSGSSSSPSGGASSDTSGQSSQGSGSSSSMGGTSGSESSSQGKYGATGRMMGHQETRASQLTGAQVSDSSGQTLGTINDVIVNPASGRIDFAVISLSPSAGATTGATGEKLVPVPWSLLRPSSTAAATGTSGQQPSFTFTGEQSKLQSAPSFSQSNWPDISQPSWRQSVFSAYGLSAGSATGGAESPGGSSGSMSPDSSGSSGSSTSPSGSSEGSSSPSSGSSSSGSSRTPSTP